MAIEHLSANVERTSITSPSRGFPGAPFLLAIGLAVAHIPVMFAYGQQLWLRQHYQFFPFLLVACLFLVYQRTKNLGTVQPGNPILLFLLLVLNIPLLTASAYSGSPWLGMFSVLWAGVVVCYGFGGWRLLRILVGPGLLLLLIFYPPFGWDLTLIRKLQSLVSYWGGQTLDVIGVPHLMTGNVVKIHHHRLLVEEACSGVHSFFSTVAFTLFYCLWRKRFWLHSLLLLAASVGWVIVVNVCRIALIAYFQAEWNYNLLEGWKHEAFGICMFIVCLGLVLSTDNLLLFCGHNWRLVWNLFRNREAPENLHEVNPNPQKTVFAPGGIRGWVVCLMLIPFLVIGLNPGWSGQIWKKTAVSALPITNKALPEQVDEWKCVRSMQKTSRTERGVYGDHSHNWYFQRNGIRAEVSLDYGFSGWHELTDCYLAQGWSVKKRTPHMSAVQDSVSFVEVDLQKGFAEKALLLFGLITSKGEWLESKPLNLTDRFQDKLFRNHYTKTTFQVQVFVPSSLELTSEEREEIRNLFQEACQRFSKELIELNQVSRP